MSGFEVLQRGGPSEVEEVATDPAIARAAPLSTPDVREAMLDGGALSQALPALGRLAPLAQPVLQHLVLCDGHGSAGAESRRGALSAHWTGVTDVRLELDHHAEAVSY